MSDKKFVIVYNSVTGKLCYTQGTGERTLYSVDRKNREAFSEFAATCEVGEIFSTPTSIVIHTGFYEFQD